MATHARTATETTSYAQQLFTEVDEWFACDVAAGPFSFIGICDSLGIDPGYIRRGLRVSRPQLAGRNGRHALRRIAGSRTRIIRPRMRQVA